MTVGVRITGRLLRTDVTPLVSVAARDLPRAGPGGLRCDVRGAAPDLVTVEALARLALLGRRHACRLHIEGASPELRRLVHLAGLEWALHP